MPAAHTQSASRWPTILLIVGAGVVSAFQAGKAPMALDGIQNDLGLSLAVASWIISAFAVMGALTGLAIGVAVDHAGAKRLAIGGLLLQAAGSAAGALAGGAPLLLASRAVEGFGFLATAIAAPALIAAVAPARNRDRAFALWATFFPVGMTIIMLSAPLLSVLGWRGFWLVNAGLLLAYALLFAMAVGPAPATGSARRSVTTDMRQLLSAGGPWLLAGLFAAYLAIYLAVFGFLPTILSDRLAVSGEAGSMLSAVAVAAGAVGCLACGQLLARGARPWLILVVTFGLMALCGFGIFSESVSGWVAYALCIVFSFVGGFIPVVLIDAVPRHVARPTLIGAGMGFLMQGNNVGFVIGPAVTGVVASSFGWPAVSFFMLAVAVIAVVLALVFRARPSEIAQGE
ncbi:MAG: MFS transporter [Rhizobiales bacterium]|nr:MFS transporter [Hyphomicrobiales bacterium]